jgi:hypothetical protein
MELSIQAGSEQIATQKAYRGGGEDDVTETFE